MLRRRGLLTSSDQLGLEIKEWGKFERKVSLICLLVAWSTDRMITNPVCDKCPRPRVRYHRILFVILLLLVAVRSGCFWYERIGINGTGSWQVCPTLTRERYVTLIGKDGVKMHQWHHHPLLLYLGT